MTGTKGIAYLDYIKQEVEVLNSEKTFLPEIEKKEPLELELEHFLDCVSNDRAPMVSGVDGLKTLEIAIKAEQVSTTREG